MKANERKSVEAVTVKSQYVHSMYKNGKRETSVTFLKSLYQTETGLHSQSSRFVNDTSRSPFSSVDGSRFPVQSGTQMMERVKRGRFSWVSLGFSHA